MKMNKLNVNPTYLKNCLSTYQKWSKETQQSLGTRLEITQGSISQALNQTETNGNASLGFETATKLFNMIGGDVYEYMPDLEKPKSANDRKNDKEAYFYICALASPHPKEEQRVPIPHMYKPGWTQNLDKRPSQLDATHTVYRHELIHGWLCKSVFAARALEMSVLDTFVLVRKGEYIFATEAEIIAQVDKAASIWSNDRVQKIMFCT